MNDRLKPEYDPDDFAVGSTFAPILSVEEKERRLQEGEEAAELRKRIDEKRASEIVEMVNARMQAGVLPARICAECESGINREQLERLVHERRASGGRGHWLDHKSLRHLAALEKWLEEEQQAIATPEASYADTVVFRAVYGALKRTHKGRTLCAIVGPYGIGKTFSAKTFAMDHARPPNGAGAMYFEFPPETKGDAGVLDAVLKALEPYVDPKGTSKQKLDRIISLLKPGDMLIADECGIPAERGTGLRFLSYIHEHARVAIAMIGNPSFVGAVWGSRTEYDALASRTMRIALTGNQDEDVDAYMEWRGVAGRRWKSVVTAVAKLTGRDGGLRAVDLVFREMTQRGLEETHHNFVEAAKTLGRTVGSN
jgi:DNA transposition AAA+ family ATPase